MVDTLYYQQPCSVCGGFHNQEAETTIHFSPKIIEAYLRKLYGKKFDVESEIEPTIWREVLKYLNQACVEGIAQSNLPPTLEQDFYSELKQSNGVFAALKVHSMGNVMAAMLTDENGKLKPFRQWKEDVASIASHYMGSWLQTEYNTAVIRAHNAADWLNFERNKDIFPNLRWMPTVSPNPDEVHQRFWERKLTRPINDPFWNKHRPGDRWNCKCSLEATDDPVTDIPGETDQDQPQPGLKGNPAKTKQIFDKSHPYFPKSCKGCKFNKSGFVNFFNIVQGNNCYNCQQVHALFLSNMPIEDIRAHIISNKLLPGTPGSHAAPNLLTGAVLTSKKVASRLIAHIRKYEEYEAADYIWNHIDKLIYYKKSPLGVNKNLNDIKDAKNIEQKIGRGIVSYHVYGFNYQNEMWTLKTEEHIKGFEQPYAIYKKNPEAVI